MQQSLYYLSVHHHLCSSGRTVRASPTIWVSAPDDVISAAQTAQHPVAPVFQRGHAVHPVATICKGEAKMIMQRGNMEMATDHPVHTFGTGKVDHAALMCPAAVALRVRGCKEPAHDTPRSRLTT